MGSKTRKHEAVRVGWSVFSICLIVAMSVLFNVFPDKVGTVSFAASSVRFTPILAPGFESVLPTLNLWWALAFSLHLAYLVLRGWTPATRWLDLVLHLFGASMLGWMSLRADTILLRGSAANGQRLLALLCLVTLFAAGKRLQGLTGLKPIVIQWEQG